MAVGGRGGVSGRGGTGDGAERAELLGAVALLLPEVPPAELRRVRGRVGEALVPGAGLLGAAAGEGEESPGGGARLSLEVDQDHLPMREDEECL